MADWGRASQVTFNTMAGEACRIAGIAQRDGKVVEAPDLVLQFTMALYRRNWSRQRIIDRAVELVRLGPEAVRAELAALALGETP